MLEAIGIKLITVLTGFLFEHGLASVNTIEIDDAPSWYYKEASQDYIYVFSFKSGGIETIDPLKKELEDKMEKKVQGIIDTIIYENFKNVNDPAEKRLIKAFAKDPDLHLFIKGHIKTDRVTQQNKREKSLLHKARPQRTFASAILSKKDLIKYQKERVTKLREEIEKDKAGKGFKGLDKEFESNDVEDELEGEIPTI